MVQLKHEKTGCSAASNKATAKSDSGVCYLLILSAGDIFDHYWAKHKQSFLSTVPRPRNQKGKIRYVYHNALLLCTL